MPKTRSATNIIEVEDLNSKVLEDETRPYSITENFDIQLELECDDDGGIIDPKVALWLARRIEPRKAAMLHHFDLFNDNASLAALCPRLDKEQQSFLARHILRDGLRGVIYPFNKKVVIETISDAIRFPSTIETAPPSFDIVAERLTDNFALAMSSEEIEALIANACLRTIGKDEVDPEDGYDTLRLAKYAVDFLERNPGKINPRAVANIIPKILEKVLEYFPELPDSRRPLFRMLTGTLAVQFNLLEQGGRRSTIDKCVRVASETFDFANHPAGLVSFVDALGFDDFTKDTIEAYVLIACSQSGVIDPSKLKKVCKELDAEAFADLSLLGIMNRHVQELADMGTSLAKLTGAKFLRQDYRTAIIERMETFYASYTGDAQDHDFFKSFLNEISKPKYVGRFSKEQKAVLVKIMPLSLTEDMVKSGYISAEDGIDQILEKSNIPAD